MQEPVDTDAMTNSELAQLVKQQNNELNMKFDALTKSLNRILKNKVYSVKEIAEITGKSQRAIRYYIENKQLQSSNNGKGKNYLITQEALSAFLNIQYENKWKQV